MSESQLPAEYSSGFEVKHDGKVVPLAVNPQVGKVLHPRIGIDHATVATASLRLGLVTQHCVLAQCVWRCRYLRYCPSAAMFLTPPSNMYTCQCPDAPGFTLAPVQLSSQPANTVPRMFLVDLLQFADCLLVTCCQYGRRCVRSAASNTQDACKVFPPSRVDLFQDG